MSVVIVGKRWLPLFSSVALLVGPVTPEAIGAARQAFQDVKGDFDFKEVDYKDPIAAEAADQLYLKADKAYVLALASGVVFDWQGVGGPDPDNETELAFDKALLPDLFENHLVFEAFSDKYVRPYLEAAMEKNGLSRSRSGSTPSAENNTAPTA